MNRQQFLRHLGIAATGLVAAGRLRGDEPARVSLPDFHSDRGEAFWDAVRREYRIEAGLGYLNTGGLGPAPRHVQAIAAEVALELQTSVQTGRARFEPARATVARFFGVEPEELAFVRNTTEGNGIIAAGLRLREGDEVIFESHAHPGGSFPWLQQQRQCGVVVKVFDPSSENPAEILERIKAVATSRTRVVQVSHVTAPTGIVMPVRELASWCRERGIWLHVDGAQSAGMFPFDLHEIDCDSFATSGHKWLGAPHETGVLIVRKHRLEEISAPIVGAHSADLDELPGELEPYPGAARFEYGTRNAAAVVATAAAVEWQEQVGRERIAKRGRELTARLRAGLQPLPDVEILTPQAEGLSASILTFRSRRIRYDTLFSRLFGDHRLRCRPVSEQHLDALRVSCHLFNTTEEIDRLIEAVDQLHRSIA